MIFEKIAVTSGITHNRGCLWIEQNPISEKSVGFFVLKDSPPDT
jgi:hypothetical protein